MLHPEWNVVKVTEIVGQLHYKTFFKAVPGKYNNESTNYVQLVNNTLWEPFTLADKK